MIMVDLLERYFGEIIQCAGTMYIVIALILAFLKVSKTEENRPYRISKNLLASCFFLMGLNVFSFLVVFTGDWRHANDTVACIDLVLYYLVGILFSFAFCNLLDKNYITRHRVAVSCFKWGLATVSAILSLFQVFASMRQWLLLFSLLLLLEFIGHFLIFYIRRFRQVEVMLDGYYSEDMRQFVCWINRSIVLLILSGVFAILTIRQGAVFNWLYQFYVLSFNMYIAVNFINYSEQYARVMKAEVRMEEEKDGELEKSQLVTSLSDATEKSLETKIGRWVEAKKYTDAQFTIDDMAVDLGTNKNYLSHFINKRYGVNFRTWVASLRIEEAKGIICDDPEQKLETVAYKVGFSSLSYFSKAFSKIEGVSPLAWRKQNYPQ